MILISGATGRVGAATCKALHDAGVPLRALVRDAAKFGLPAGPGTQIVTGDMENAADVAAALKGATAALLLMSNNPKQAAIERQFASLAADAGVRHLVKISSQEAGPDARATLPRQHYESEQFIASLPLDWTFLRPNFYLQNMLMFAASISKAGVFALPLGKARCAMVDTRDVGAVAAAVLQGGAAHAGQIYELTNDSLMDFHEAAERMSTVLGRPIRYVEQSAADFRATMARFISSEWQLNAVCELFAEIASGSLEHLSDDLPRLLGRPATRLEAFTSDFSRAFAPA